MDALPASWYAIVLSLWSRLLHLLFTPKAPSPITLGALSAVQIPLHRQKLNRAQRQAFDNIVKTCEPTTLSDNPLGVYKLYEAVLRAEENLDDIPKAFDKLSQIRDLKKNPLNAHAAVSLLEFVRLTRYGALCELDTVINLFQLTETSTFYTPDNRHALLNTMKTPRFAEHAFEIMHKLHYLGTHCDFSVTRDTLTQLLSPTELDTFYQILRNNTQFERLYAYGYINNAWLEGYLRTNDVTQYIEISTKLALTIDREQFSQAISMINHTTGERLQRPVEMLTQYYERMTPTAPAPKSDPTPDPAVAFMTAYNGF